ncbi:MAG: DUF839 domain-containing protein [Thiocapsa sp.]|nr:alkaline phosphatase PhoX [Thiocapsa sp.]MCG6896880.1 DUF839 domain-containing protein [Thiocapsa sp.]MCG6985504.1 DUF839 domain-containing protein [Thiocapsa sp.]
MPLSRKQFATLVYAFLAAATVPALADSLEFKEVPVPVLDEEGSDAEKRAIVATDTAWLRGNKIEIGFKTLMRSGQGFAIHEEITEPQLPFGTLVDNKGKPIPAAGATNDGATPSADDNNPFLSNDNDFNSLIPHGEKLFMVSHFESRPGGMYVSELDQDPEDGELTALWTRPIDFSAVRGGWVHCAGSVTPWNTHLGSEEYEPDARLVDPMTGNKVDGEGEPDHYYHAMADYFQGDRTRVNPYDYGYPVEVSIKTEKGDTEVTKHYAMGRTALELAYVMPDRRTAYLTDDGRMVGLFMFVADQENDLSSGKLYAARWEQKSPDGWLLGKAHLRWIDLGHAKDSEIAAHLAGPEKLRFEDIFNAEVPNSDGSCREGYSLVAKGHEQTAGNTYAECLKLRPGMRKAASRLETRRYAAMVGATTEFTKEEGITYDPDTHRLYIAMSDVTDGMLNNDEAEQYNGVPAGPNHVRVEENRCGAVYAADTKGWQKDASGRPIRSSYVAVNMYPLLAGNPNVDYDGTPYEGNECSVNGISNPDNISYLPGYHTLIIGEDTDRHQNDMVWSYNTKKGQLTRIQTTPYGSETTSVYWHPNINGFGYLMSVVQHPFGESDEEQYITGSSADRGYSGYIGAFPALR